MQGGTLIGAVWLTFQVFFPADNGAKSRNVAANRFYTRTYTDLISAKESLNSLVRGMTLVFGFEL